MKSDRCSGALKFEMAKLAEHLEYWTDISQKVMLAWEWANILAKIKEVQIVFNLWQIIVSLSNPTKQFVPPLCMFLLKD